MAKSVSVNVEVPEGLLLESIQDLRMVTSGAYKIFSEVALLRGAIDSARALKGTAMPIAEHCVRILRNVDRLTKAAAKILVRIRKHLEGDLTDTARTFLDGIDHILVGLIEAVTERIEGKTLKIKERMQDLIVESSRLNQLLFEAGKESVFCLASSLVEAADQIRRQLPKDWTIEAVMRWADPPVIVNGKNLATASV